MSELAMLVEHIEWLLCNALMCCTNLTAIAKCHIAPVRTDSQEISWPVPCNSFKGHGSLESPLFYHLHLFLTVSRWIKIQICNVCVCVLYSLRVGLKHLLKQASYQKVYNGLQGYWHIHWQYLDWSWLLFPLHTYTHEHAHTWIHHKDSHIHPNTQRRKCWECIYYF